MKDLFTNAGRGFSRPLKERKKIRGITNLRGDARIGDEEAIFYALVLDDGAR